MPLHATASGSALSIVPFGAVHEAPCIELWAHALPEMFLDPPPATCDQFRDSTEGETIFVAMLDDSVGGFASVWDPDRFVHFLVSDPLRRRCGIGRALLNHAVAHLGRPVDLKCQLHNASARAFYERLGWEAVERVTDAPQPYIRYRLP